MGACISRQRSTVKRLTGKTVEDASQQHHPALVKAAGGVEDAQIAPVKVFRDGQVCHTALPIWTCRSGEGSQTRDGTGLFEDLVSCQLLWVMKSRTHRCIYPIQPLHVPVESRSLALPSTQAPAATFCSEPQAALKRHNRLPSRCRWGVLSLKAVPMFLTASSPVVQQCSCSCCGGPSASRHQVDVMSTFLVERLWGVLSKTGEACMWLAAGGHEGAGSREGAGEPQTAPQHGVRGSCVSAAPFCPLHAAIP